MKNMKLSELLRRKMADYGYRDEAEMAKALGIDEERLRQMMQGAHVYPGYAERQAISRVLDVDPGVLRAMMEMPGLRDYEMATLIAYGRHEMSIRQTARALFVHPTTVGYRLDKIQSAPGWTRGTGAIWRC